MITKEEYSIFLVEYMEEINNPKKHMNGLHKFKFEVYVALHRKIDLQKEYFIKLVEAYVAKKNGIATEYLEKILNEGGSFLKRYAKKNNISSFEDYYDKVKNNEITIDTFNPIESNHNKESFDILLKKIIKK